MTEQLTIFINSLDLATTFSISVMAIVFIGILIMELITGDLNPRAKKLAFSYLGITILIEVSLILDQISNTLDSPHLLLFELVTASIALLWAIFALVRFRDILRPKLMRWGIVLGVFATSEVVVSLVWHSNLYRLIGIIATNGVMIFLYLLVLTLVIDNRRNIHYEQQ